MIAESTTFAILALPQYSVTGGFATRIVPGLPGQVAVGDDTGIHFFSHAQLQ